MLKERKQTNEGENMNKTENNKDAAKAYNAIINAGLMPCIEVNESVIYFEPSPKGFAFGTACNCGLLKDGEFEYDSDFTEACNLQALCEEIHEYYENI